jgi:hypothetical protein
MLARFPQGFNRRAALGMSIREVEMRWVPIFSFAILALILIGNAGTAFAQQPTNGKNCRMEQQCHWENFRKICVWMKVCR